MTRLGTLRTGCNFVSPTTNVSTRAGVDEATHNSTRSRAALCDTVADAARTTSVLAIGTLSELVATDPLYAELAVIQFLASAG